MNHNNQIIHTSQSKKYIYITKTDGFEFEYKRLANEDKEDAG